MFSWNVFKVNLVELELISERQMFAMQQECYTMRKNDPVGRARSNNGSGWQSNDGVNERPIFQSLLNGVETVFDNEVFPFYNCEEDRISVSGNVMCNTAKTI